MAQWSEIAGRRSSVDVAYVRECGVWYTRSSDGGETFGAAEELLPQSTPQCPDAASVARGSAGVVVVAWADRLTRKVYVRVSTDGGSAFVGQRAVADLTDCCLDPPVMVSTAVADGTIYLAYVPTFDVIRVTRSFDLGRSWSASALITETADYKRGYDLVAEHQNAYIAWSSKRDPAGVHYRRTTDSGDSWSPTATLSSVLPGVAFVARYHRRPDLSLREGIVRVVFPDSDDSVLYRESQDGVTWTKPHDFGETSQLGHVAFAGNVLVLYQDPLTHESFVVVGS